jgi:hypothetical protein
LALKEVRRESIFKQKGKTMTFEEAVDIVHSVTIPATKEEIIVKIDGKKHTVKAEVKDKLALYRFNRQWHLIHVLTGLGVYSCESYLEALSLMNRILDRQIDLCFTMRDIRVMKSILQLIGARKEHILQLPPEPRV